ncbi:hypothetical protein SODALDRAFT_321683 [Sodiomyces alkalinus F11]|uniref:JmjC domain-containing protein n=1 Tax=Sodiomyces alkalinus (strain CBS 110278 / VKM F-3762 / F11) TaxID=1314773 RepID=A0A3N2Q0Q0_SODAK|nr:hypothetical protein SODALDRAFT_321683 [Sodiomyces alkalinus F11]ROT40310.1 hypothetical protein SODALDRAFT_321683 [Sodiomyces alkalinus F11]
MRASLHPQAKFDPIPPDLDLYGLVDRCANFEWVLRISIHQIRNLGPEEFEKLVLLHVIQGGKPLVIEGWDEVLPPSLFSAQWLEQNLDKKQENVRDVMGQYDIPMTTGHYLRSMKQLTNQWSPSNYRDERRQRLYLKDIDCPAEWHDYLRKIIPPSLFYMNENVTQRGGGDERQTEIFGGGFESTATSAGDLMSSLPEEMRAQNLMCYIGHEGTFTPAHREMCASLGQNIMVEASGKENGEKEGSSIWFMTETKDREVVREYFLSMLGHDVEIEKHFAQINAWKKAPFPVYIVEQRPGDFILIPPLAPHQVWNRGTRTMKVAWNRTTVETLELALHEALPKARLVCRDEQYKNKAIVYFTLKKYYQLLRECEEKNEMSLLGFEGFGRDLFRSSPRFKQLARDFRSLFALFTEIMTDEMFATKEKNVEFIEYDSCVVCSYCRSNIFNRFLTCKNCVRTLVNGDEDAYDVCMECYAMGRSCMCQSHLTWCEQFPWSELVDNYEAWRSMVIKNDGFVDLDYSPPPLEVARARRGKKSTAQICQEALRRRPFKDLNKPDEEKAPSESEPEPEVDDEGRPKKKYKRKAKKGDTRRCHVCCHKDYTYRVHECTTPGCREAYCYGVLYRAFDMMPQTVLENENWQCPRCLGICNCGACRRASLGNPYMPKNTLLGHDTKAIADDRSVELLVDFRVHNLNWLKAMGDESRTTDSRRMRQLREQADVAKAQDVTGAKEAIENVTNGGGAVDARNDVNGYGDQSHILAGPSMHETYHDENGDDRAPGSHQELGYLPHHVDPSAGPFPGHGVGDDSSYPDPMMMGGQRMLGMGYYEQDAGPDQILFDPFQMPSADAIAFDEEAEVVKKALRAQKRKARQEGEDDPDFYAPRPHKKKKKDTLDSTAVDPALLGAAGPSGGDNSTADLTGNVGESEAAPHAQPAQEATTEVEVHVPELRPTRPRISYAEDAEPLLDEIEDVLPAWSAGRPRKPQHATDGPATAARGGALDRASAAARARMETGDAGAAATPDRPKRRGRPPRQVSSSSSSATPMTRSAEKSAGVSPADFAARQRAARASRRSGLATVETAGDSAEDGEGEDDTDEAAAELEAELEKDLARGGETEMGRPADTDVTPVPRRRGRPPKNRTAAAPTTETDIKRMSLAERLAAKGKKLKIRSRNARSSQGGETASPGPGSTRPESTPRTRRSEDPTSPGPAAAAVEEEVEEESPTAAPGRESPEPAPRSEEPNSPVASETNESRRRKSATEDNVAPGSPMSEGAAVRRSPHHGGGEYENAEEEDEQERERSPRPAKNGPTIVRLGSHSGSEFEDEAASETPPAEAASELGSDYDSGSSDDEIPATISRDGRGATHATRGTGRGGGRGRGRPRGRGRGRPRGR